MRIVTDEEYNELKPIIKKEMIRLAEHENKDSYMAQIATNNCYVRKLSGDLQLFQLFSPGFIPVIEHDYLNALKETPAYFGTFNAKDVLLALYEQAKKRYWVWDAERYEDYLSNEIFCLLICRKNKMFLDDILRIDLFRHTIPSKDYPGCFDFEGGIFHALKHFSVEEQCASILPNQNVFLYDAEQLIWPIAKAFYEGTWEKGEKAKTFNTFTTYLNKLFILGFYKEDNSNVAFVNTLIPKNGIKNSLENKS